MTESARLGGTGLVVSMTRSRRLQQLMGDLEGGAAWARVTRTLRRYDQQMGAALQQMVVDEYQRTRVHPERPSTGRLAAATLDSRNFRRFTSGGVAGWGVGVPSFLDKSQAKYWRQIEEGSDAHLGRFIFGMWTGRGRLSYHGYGRGEKFLPFSDMSPAQRQKVTWGRLGARITRPIEAQHAYQNAFAVFRRRRVPRTIFRIAVAQELKIPYRTHLGRSFGSVFSGLTNPK